MPSPSPSPSPLVSPPYSSTPKNKAERDFKISVLYEEYIKLAPCIEAWSTPVTQKPILEPTFAAGWQGIELAFVLLAEFVRDGREYVVKRPRVEMVAGDVMAQMNLVSHNAIHIFHPSIYPSVLYTLSLPRRFFPLADQHCV